MLKLHQLHFLNSWLVFSNHKSSFWIIYNFQITPSSSVVNLSKLLRSSPRVPIRWSSNPLSAFLETEGFLVVWAFGTGGSSLLVMGPEAEIVEEAGFKGSPWLEVGDLLNFSILGIKPGSDNIQQDYLYNVICCFPFIKWAPC